jgi:hypothetical protein
MQMFGRVLMLSKDAMMLLVFFVFIAVILFGALIYFFEGGTLDDATGVYLRIDKFGSAQERTPFSSM